MRNAHCTTWNMAKKQKTWKMRNAYFRKWNMMKKTEKH